MKKEKTVKKVRDEIDKAKASALGKQKSHHLTRITGSRDPVEYVVCTDGTEIGYSKSEEEIVIAMLIRQRELENEEKRENKANIS